MTKPEKLRRWATNRERLGLDGRLLRETADELERLRLYVKELELERRAAA